MNRLALLLLGAATLSWSTHARAFEFICHGYYITNYASSGCPLGNQEQDSCGCTSTQPSTAPKWLNGQLPMIVESQGGNGVTATQFVTASRNAAQAWTDVTCSFAAITATQTMAQNASAAFDDDGKHSIYWVAGESEWMAATGSGAGGTLGVTLAPYGGFGCSSREFYDADILINGFVLGGWTLSSIEATILHEQGHALGLGHPCLLGITGAGCNSTCSAVMAASGGDFTTPQQDDVNGLCALYPGTPGGLGSSCDANADCNSNRCVTYEGFSYCTQTCGTCPTGYNCTNVSGTSVCTRKGAPITGEPCTSTCAPGATCVGDGAGGGTCYADCNPASPTCPATYRCAGLQEGGGVCVPPGSLQAGEDCSSADCAAGLTCLIDGGTDQSPIAHCYVLCDETLPSSCGNAKLCFDLGDGTGACLEAALADKNCEVTDYVCVAGYTCAPPSSGTAAATCKRECDRTNAASCGPGLACVTLLNQQNQPIGGACYPAGTSTEGAPCIGTLDCQTGLVCMSGAGGATCLVACTPPSGTCPHAGQTCTQYSTGKGVCSPANGTGPGGPGPSGCACDVTTACDPGCSSCDPECARSSSSGGGCAASPGGQVSAWFGALVALCALRRRRAAPAARSAT